MNKIIAIVILYLAFVIPVLVQSQDEKIDIVASHSILMDVVQNIVGDHAQVTVTMPRGADPHSFVASPGDLTVIANADIVFVNGAFFEEGLLESIENAGESNRIVTVSSCVPIIPIGESVHHHDDHEEHDEDHKDHDEEHLHDFDSLCSQHVAEIQAYHELADTAESLGQLYEVDCAENSCDPHVWMNPINVMYWTLLIRDTLIETDPINAEIYHGNAQVYLAELDTLMNDFLIPLVDTLPIEQRVLITSHDSLGYLAEAFDFEVIGTIIPNGSTIAEPSIQDIARLIDLIHAEGVPAIFGETTVNADITQTIADETGAELVVLYSGSLSDESLPASTYLDYIRYNYTAIVNALKG